MDMDMLVLRPLDSLRNTVGSEITDSGDLRLNGAVLAFDKSRSGLSAQIQPVRLIVQDCTYLTMSSYGNLSCLWLLD